MPHNLLDTYSFVTKAAALEAADRDATGSFPDAAFQALRDASIISRPPLAPNQAVDLLWMLAAAGRGDLSVGRILEGHVNTLYLIERYGSESQRSYYRRIADSGAVFGVWNTDQPKHPLHVVNGRLVGCKSFATGIDGLQYAIVTVAANDARHMVIVPLQGLSVDRTWWRPLGMRASGSHVVDFTGIEIEPDWMLGPTDAYIEQPWFSAGAMRFAAVQVGGMHAILDIANDHLNATRRAADPYQKHRLGEMAVAVETGYGWLRRAAASWTSAEAMPNDVDVCAELVATVNGTRKVVEDTSLVVMELAERSVGAAGMIAPHALERKLRDLRTYLRQPNPDGALAAFGESVAAKTWQPGVHVTKGNEQAKDPRKIDAQRIAVIAPHPDDETLGCGGLIASLARIGRHVRVVFVTDGSASHRGSPTWPKNRLAACRRAEAEAAMVLLGLSAQDAVFLNLPDTGIPPAPSPAAAQARARLSAEFKSFIPDLVLLPWRRDPHCDHRDSWSLATAALNDAELEPETLEYAVWLDELGKPDDFPRTGEAKRIDFDIRASLTAKRSALAAHVSQTTDLIGDASHAFKLGPKTVERLVRPTESYWQPLS